MKDIQKIKEIGDASLQPYSFTRKIPKLKYSTNDDFFYEFTTDKGIKYTAALLQKEPLTNREFEFLFKPIGGDFKDIVNQGEVYRVMSTIVAIIKDSINILSNDNSDLYGKDWGKIIISPSKNFQEDDRRAKLYKSYIIKNLPPDVKVIGTKKLTLINKNYPTLKEMKDIQKIKEFFSKPLDEAKKETAVDIAKKQLDALGVKYEMSGNEFRPFKAIYKPINKSDKWYDKFDDIIHLFNLGSAVKQSMDEAKSEDSYEVVWTDRDYKKHSKVFKNDPKGAPDNAKKKAEAFKKSLEDKDKKSKEGLYRSIDLNEAKEDKVDTITMDIPLFLRMLEYSREDAAQDVDLHDVTEKANSLGKEKGILSMEDYDAIVGAAEDAPKTEMDEATDYMKRRKAMDDYFTSKKDKPKKPHNPTPSGKTDYMKRREKDLAEAILNKLKK